MFHWRFFISVAENPSLGTINFGITTPLRVKKVDIPMDKMDVTFQKNFLDVKM